MFEYLLPRALFLCLTLLPVAGPAAADEPVPGNERSLTLVVMDPLCDRLACDCVQGYAQRKYEALGEFLGRQLECRVDVFWGESLAAALEETDATPDIVIGKHSVVLSNADARKVGLRPVAQLTGKDGSVMQTGLIVVRRLDPAVTVGDLKGYRIFFGPADCDEKYRAPMQLLRENGIDVPSRPEISGACSEAATKLMDLDADVRAAAVISSYAEPLLAGCGTIKKGDLRIIGISDEVPFVTAFLNQNLEPEWQARITRELLAAGEQESLLKALETERGFVAFPEEESATRDSETDLVNASGKKK